MRVGGDFHYPNATTEQTDRHNLLLIAGGVGINPLASIFYHASSQQDSTKEQSLSKVKMIYSARTADELVFKDSFDLIAREQPGKFDAEYFVTREESKSQSVSHGRFTSKQLKDSLQALSDLPTFCYICGPTAFIQDTNRILQDLGLPKSSIFFELWW